MANHYYNAEDLAKFGKIGEYQKDLADKFFGWYGAAFAAGGQHWIEVWLPMRFTDYARSLGYSVSERYASVKAKEKGHTLPLVLTGKTRDAVVDHSTFTIRNSSSKISFVVRMPLPSNIKGYIYGYSTRSQVRQMLTTIPPREIISIAKVIKSALHSELTGRLTERMTGSRQPAAGYSRQTAPKGTARSKSTGRA